MSQDLSTVIGDVGGPKIHSKPPIRKFNCNLCQRQFNRREHLQRHQSIRKDYNHKPHHCQLCDYACRRRDLLNRHMRLTHTEKLTATRKGSAGPSCGSDSNEVGAPLPEDPAQEGLGANSHPQQSTALSLPGHMQTVYDTSATEHPLHPICEPDSELPSFAFNYLDGVSLPLFDAQPAFYPELSLNDSLLFSPLDNNHTGLQVENMKSEKEPDSNNALPGRLSRLGSFSPEPQIETTQAEPTQPCQQSASFMRISQGDWIRISESLAKFKSILPADHKLPSRHSFTRYLHGFVTGFHPHFPILHLPTLSIQKMPPELIIALAAVGAHYCLELHQGVKLFHIARAIALEQVRLHESLMEQIDAFPDPGGFFPTPPSASTGYYERPEFNTSDLRQPPIDPKEDYATIGTMQALFFLMAMATWAGTYRPLVRHAISTQSVLAMMIRQHGLHETPSDASTWEDWARVESSRRTKLIIFSFFNLHRILLNLPSPIIMSDVNLRLPCTEKLWKAPSARSWSSVVQDSEQPLLFQECFAMLFKPSEPAPACSSLGSHIMIHALLQHIFSVQQATRLGSLTDGLGSELSTSLGKALKKWQKVWELNSESSLNPLDKHGPIAFNSTALFHLAYIRLAADIGPARSLLEHTHTQIAAKLMDQPDLQRGPMLTLAARHATAALCPPVQMGVYFVGRAPSWSVMHAVCSMDYAYILNQFLKAITAKDLEYPLGADEKLVLNVLKETLREVESASPHGNPEVIDSTPHLLGPRAVRAWAIILQGMRTWNAVDLITKTLFTYVDLLERCACQY